MGDKLIALPYEQMKADGKKIMLPGATKDSLKALPEFKYASTWARSSKNSHIRRSSLPGDRSAAPVRRAARSVDRFRT